MPSGPQTECTLDSLGGLVKQTAGPHSCGFLVNRLGVGPVGVHFQQGLGGADAEGPGPVLRAPSTVALA